MTGNERGTSEIVQEERARAATTPKEGPGTMASTEHAPYLLPARREHSYTAFHLQRPHYWTSPFAGSSLALPAARPEPQTMRLYGECYTSDITIGRHYILANYICACAAEN
jgi:hypothetical protein